MWIKRELIMLGLWVFLGVAACPKSPPPVQQSGPADQKAGTPARDSALTGVPTRLPDPLTDEAATDTCGADVSTFAVSVVFWSVAPVAVTASV